MSRKSLSFLCIFVLALLLFLAACDNAAPDEHSESGIYYSYGDIVSRLTDLRRLASVPSEGEASLQFSSYDRSSYYDSENDTYVDWDANMDGWGSLGRTKNDDGIIAAEIRGAGYINRFRSDITYSDGHIRIFIDDENNPTIDMPFKDFVTWESGCFPYDQLCYVVSGGTDMLVPITFNSYCRIELCDGWGNFYIIGYTLLEEGACVEPFSYPINEKNDQILKEANELLKADTAEANGQLNYEIGPGETVTVLDDSSAGAVSSIQLNIKELDGFDTDAALNSVRNLSINMYWDGASEPAVSLSVGDFFDSPTGITVHSCFPVGVLENGTMYANWYMPYEQALITLTNNGETPINVGLFVQTEDLNREEAENLMRFCARWATSRRRYKSDCKWPDADYFTLTGCGRMVGLIMHNYQYSDNVWWGEGDEKFYIDGEKFPSWYGTGSEDYFGYGYASAKLFSYPFHSQTVAGDTDAARLAAATGGELVQAVMSGNKVLSRWHIDDSIVFRTSLDIDFENYESVNAVKSSATVFYYMTKDTVSDNASDMYDVSVRNKGYSKHD